MRAGGRGAIPAKGQERNGVSAQNTDPRRIEEQDFAPLLFIISTDDIKLFPAAFFLHIILGKKIEGN